MISSSNVLRFQFQAVARELVALPDKMCKVAQAKTAGSGDSSQGEFSASEVAALRKSLLHPFVQEHRDHITGHDGYGGDIR